MLTILGRRDANSRFCDGLSRRGFLQVGGAAMGGLALNQILAAESAPGAGTHQSIINIYLPGGPSHLDMWDLKPNAPVEVRGEFNPIQTSVPGIQICELFPRVASMMDKFAVIRSLSDSDGRHDCYQCMTGRRFGQQGPSAGWPSAGAWISRLKGPVNQAVPPNLALMYTTGNRTWGEPGKAGFLGPAHDPFNLVGRKDRVTFGPNLPDWVDGGWHAPKDYAIPDRPVFLKTDDAIKLWTGDWTTIDATSIARTPLVVEPAMSTTISPP